MADLDLGTLRGKVELDVDGFDRKYSQVDKDLDALAKRKSVDPTIDADITKAEKKVAEAKRELEVLGRMESSPEVEADIVKAQRDLDKAESRLKALDGLRGDMVVDADVDPAEEALDGLGEEGVEAGEDAGAGLSDGIKGALSALPVAGAVVLAAAAIGKTLIDGIQDALSIEVSRDLFSAQTGLDEVTAGRFGRAAGEAYANALGESVEANMSTARAALQQGLIDEDSTQREIQTVVEQLTAISDVFDYDIPQAARGVGQLLKTGLVADAEEAFDLITKASQGVMSDDLMDTLNEYASQFETVGLTGEEAMGLIRQGLDAGARDTDKVADAVKEMGLRIREGTDPAIEALANLGLQPQEMVEAFQAGGPEAAAAMDTVFDALRTLDEEGGNTQEVIANLFGGPGEDLGAALFALDLDTATEALGETEGAAQRLLDTLGGNAAAEIEGAQRDIELASDGIKGALAAAFSDEIAGAAEWVRTNRGPLLEFFADAINVAFDFAGSLVEAAAAGTEAFGSFAGTSGQLILGMIDSVLGALETIPGMSLVLGDARDRVAELAEGFGTFDETTSEAADWMRENLGGGLDDMQAEFNDWVGPEIMSAHVHDAVVRMTDRMDEFSAAVDDAGGTVEINGDTLNAEDAMATLIEMIDEETGEVTINGETVPADEALDELMDSIANSEEPVTVTADRVPADEALEALMQAVADSEEDVTLGGRDVPAQRVLDNLMDDVAGSEEEVTIGGNDYPADRALRAVLRAIENGEESVTIDGNRYPANEATRDLLDWINDRGAEVDVDADTSAASSKVSNFVGSWQDHRIRMSVRAETMAAGGGYISAPGFADGGDVQGFPGGGPVFGAGSATSDSIPAWLSNGEYVIRADMVDHYGRELFDALNGGAMPAAPTTSAQSSGEGMYVDKVYVTTASSGFSLDQVRERLRMAGAS